MTQLSILLGLALFATAASAGCRDKTVPRGDAPGGAAGGGAGGAATGAAADDPAAARPSDGATGGGDGSPGANAATGSDGGAGTAATGAGTAAGGPRLPRVPALTTFDRGKKPTREIHVSPKGSDDHGDGSGGKPFRSLRIAVGNARPGTAVVLHAGDYDPDQWIANIHGTADAPIWIGGAAGEARPRFKGGKVGIHFSGGSYLVIHDLEVTGSVYGGINFDDEEETDDPTRARFIVFRNLYLHDIGLDGNHDCLKLSGLHDFVIIGSEFGRCGGNTAGSGVDMVGCHRGVIAGNYVHDTSHSGLQIKGGSADVLVWKNRIERGGARPLNLGGSTSFQYFRPSLSKQKPNAEARRLLVVQNDVIGGLTGVAFVGCVDCVFAHNTIVDPESWVVRILQETLDDDGFEFEPSSRGRFFNNVVVYRAGKGGIDSHVNIGPHTAPKSFSFSHNLWFASDAPDRSTPKLPVEEQGGIFGQDPKLAGPPADLRICDAASPALGAGVVIDEVAKANVKLPSPPHLGAADGPPCD